MFWNFIVGMNLIGNNRVLKYNIVVLWSLFIISFREWRYLYLNVLIFFSLLFIEIYV